MQQVPVELERIYHASFHGQENLIRDRIWTVLVCNCFQRWVQPDEVALDLGCEFGEFLRRVNCGCKIGVELNPESSKFLSQAGIEPSHPNVDRW